MLKKKNNIKKIHECLSTPIYIHVSIYNIYLYFLKYISDINIYIYIVVIL